MLYFSWSKSSLFTLNIFFRKFQNFLEFLRNVDRQKRNLQKNLLDGHNLQRISFILAQEKYLVSKNWNKITDFPKRFFVCSLQEIISLPMHWPHYFPSIRASRSRKVKKFQKTQLFWKNQLNFFGRSLTCALAVPVDSRRSKRQQIIVE